MSGESNTYLTGKKILAVDDEKDILETIEDIMEDARVVTASTYADASEKIANNRYDVIILDIMGVDGLKLLEEATERNMPAVMLTAHAVNPKTLIESISKGAVSYLPKEKLNDLDTLLADLLEAYDKGESPWKLLFEKLGDFFDERFGLAWREQDREFWNEFSRTYQIGKGIQERLRKDKRLRGMGV